MRWPRLWRRRTNGDRAHADRLRRDVERDRRHVDEVVGYLKAERSDNHFRARWERALRGQP